MVSDRVVPLEEPACIYNEGVKGSVVTLALVYEVEETTVGV